MERRTTGDYREINSPRTGGWYRVTGTVEPRVAGLTPQGKKALTRWLSKQHALGVEMPEISTSTIAVAEVLPPLGFTEKIDAALLLLNRTSTRLDAILQVSPSGPQSPETAALLGVTDSDDLKDLVALLMTMKDMGLLKEAGSVIGALRLSVAPAGWQRIEQLTRTQIISSQAFVAMWFHERTTAAFEEGIAPAVIQAGYAPVRVDKVHHINKIDDQIIAEIRRSRFLVSDFTCEPEKPRGGVYFEAGFAMGLGIPVIWTCAAASLDDLHFDTRQYNHIVWKSPADLHDQLLARMGAVLGDGPVCTENFIRID